MIALKETGEDGCENSHQSSEKLWAINGIRRGVQNWQFTKQGVMGVIPP
jgi:hypothetical protein